jgi:hypothetical protein
MIPLGDKRRWEDNIKTDPKEMKCVCVAQIRVQCLTVVNAVTKLWVDRRRFNDYQLLKEELMQKPELLVS